MKKGIILFLGLFLLGAFSCEEDSDAVYLTHKLSLSASRTSDYTITFEWNDIKMNDVVRNLLVITSEEKEISFYKDILNDYMRGDVYDNWPYWADECSVYSIHQGELIYDWYDSGLQYYKLLMYNYSGEFAMSNTIVY